MLAKRSVTSTSRSLLARLRSNESDAWDRLITLYTPLMFFWCRKLNLPEQDIPDVVQDVFRAITLNIDRFRKDDENDTFRGWLRVITRSKVADYFRKRAKGQNAAGGTVALRMLAEIPDADDDAGVEDDDEPAAFNSLYLRALELIRTDFQERTWKAFWRVVVDGNSPKEVAEELGMQPGTVRVAKSRVLARLRSELGEILD